MILVTGGTGFVGSHLLYTLCLTENKVRAIHRKSSDIEYVKKVFSYFTEDAEKLYAKIEWVEADLINIPALTEAFHEVDKVYHTAAYVSFNPKNFHKLKKSNIEGTANIVNLCLYFKIKKLCYISSIATLGEGDSLKTITEESVWNPDEKNSVYAISKYGAEMEVWRGAQEGLPTIIVNPGVILGSGFWNSGTGMIFSRVHKGLSYYTNGEVGFVDVSDVVNICTSLMESNIKNERFILVSENSSYRNLLSNIAILMGKEAPKKELKSWMLQLLWRLDKIKSILLGKKQGLFESTASALTAQKKYDNSKIIKTLNYSFIPLSETLKNTVTDFKNLNH